MIPGSNVIVAALLLKQQQQGSSHEVRGAGQAVPPGASGSNYAALTTKAATPHRSQAAAVDFKDRCLRE